MARLMPAYGSGGLRNQVLPAIPWGPVLTHAVGARASLGSGPPEAEHSNALVQAG